MNLSMKKIATVLFLSITLLLTGCNVYSIDEETQVEIPYPEQIESVQRAVDTYQENSGGLLPIKTKELETDKYIKYPIDFTKIIPEYSEKIPSSAYEKGGLFQYVLMDVEENPEVKVVDLRMAERIRELNLRKSINSGSIPFNDEIGDGVFEVDFKTMGFESPLSVKSPYSDVQLPIVVGGDGHFYVDYSIDLHRILTEENPDITPGEDIRYLLEERSPILPAYSLPYTVNEQNELVFMKK